MPSTGEFGKKLQELRAAKGLTQRRLADMMTVSNGTVAHWESGTRLPDLSMLARLADCLGVESHTLIDALREQTEDIRVIIVEDVPVVLRGSVRMLKEELPDVEVAGFTSAAQALEYASHNRVSVAFLDIELPGEDGLELGRRLTALNERVNIIYLTNYAQYLADAAYDHCSGYILKPLKPERIRHELSHLRFPVIGLGL